MPPVRKPVRPELDMTIITMAETLPNSGTSMVNRLLTPSLGSNSGGACNTTLP